MDFRFSEFGDNHYLDQTSSSGKSQKRYPGTADLFRILSYKIDYKKGLYSFKPNEIKTILIDLNKIFDFKEKGKYHIKILCNVGKYNIPLEYIYYMAYFRAEFDILID